MVQVMFLRERNLDILSGKDPGASAPPETIGADGEATAVGGAGLWAAFQLSQNSIADYVKKRRAVPKGDDKGQKGRERKDATDGKKERERLLRLRRLPPETKFFVINPINGYQVCLRIEIHWID